MMNSKNFILSWVSIAWIQIIIAESCTQKKSPVETHRAFFFKSAMIYFIIDFLNMLSNLLFVS